MQSGTSISPSSASKSGPFPFELQADFESTADNHLCHNTETNAYHVCLCARITFWRRHSPGISRAPKDQSVALEWRRHAEYDLSKDRARQVAATYSVSLCEVLRRNCVDRLVSTITHTDEQDIPRRLRDTKKSA